MLIAVDYFLHLFVVVTAVAADDGVGNLMIAHATLVIHMDDDGIAEFVLVRTKGADVVA